MGSRLVTESQSLVGNIRLLNRKEYPDMYDGQEGNYPYGYFEGNHLIGKIRVTHSKGSDFYGLSRFAVEKESRGKGVGSKLLRYVIDKHGKFKLVLNVLISNDNAISLYKKNGFKITYTNNNPTIGDKYYVMTRNGKSAVHESSSVMENEYDVCTEKLSYFVDPRSYSIGDVTFVTDKDGTSNASIKLKDKLYRVRVEAIVFKDGKIYAEKLNKINQYGVNYKIPGGSIEPGLSLADSCVKECNEEMRALVTNVKYTGISYKIDYNGNYPKWHIEKLHPEGIIYEGVITCVFTAEYDGKYTGRIEEVDKDSLSKNGRWYLPSELDLSAEHISAIRTVVGESSSVMEAYSPYGTFDELCEKIRTPKQLMNWFVKSKVHWPANRVGNSKMFVWPEKLIKTRTGNCYDIALFVHYWAEAVGIENFIGLMSWVEVGNRVPEESLGHAVTILKDEDEKYYIFDYYPGKYGLRGPYKTPTEALTYIANMANARASIMLDATTIPVSSIIPPSEMAYYDEIYGKEYRQDKFIEEKDRYHMRTHIKEIYRVTGNDIKALRFAPEDFLTGLFNKVGSLIVKGKSMLTEANDTLPDENIVGPGIVNNILSVYRASGNFDDKEFAKYKSGKKFMYTRCKVMKKNVPLIVFLAYCEGLTAVLRKAEIAYTFSDKRPRLEGLDAVNKGVVDFADGYLIYNKYPLHKSLLMNGLSVVQTKNINYEEMDMKDTYLDVFDSLFGARMLANALDNFYEWMIDVPTKEILDDLNYPTDFVGLLLAGNKLLADNNYRDEIDMANWRIRNNELVYAYAYKRIAEAYTKFRMTAGNKNPVKVTIPRNAVLKDVMMSQIVEDVSELSPIVEAEKAHTVTDKGPSGTNLEQAYTQERRCFHPSMKGVMAISTSPDANVGLMRELTVEPNIINARGYVAPPDDRNVNDVNLFSMAEMLTPLGVTRDDPIRTSMSSKQSKHIIPVENSSPVLMSNGIEKVLPYHLSTDFSVVAKDDGEVVERNEDQGVIIVKYKHIAGDDAYQVINMNTKVVKNGAGGFFLTNKLNCDKLKKGYRFKKNDILAYNKRFFSDSKSDGTRFNIGTLVKVACMGSYANFEDGDCITTKLSKKLGTEICMPCEAVIGANSNVDYIAKVGQAVGVNEPLVIFDQSSKDASFNKMLANIGEDLKEEITGLGKTPIKSKYAGVIQDIKIYSTIDLDEMSPSLRKIVARYYDGIKAKKKIISKYRKGDSLNDYTFTEQDKKIESEDGKIMGVTVGEGVLIRFFIKYHDNMDVGDKLVHFAALKCVNGEMIPEGLEPYTVNNPEEEISTTFAPAAVLARMVPSVMQTMYGNKIIIELKRRWLEMYKKDNPGFKPKDELY
jgi:GNAT superfamily N-acetyltransferase